jgi:hypothetical protein
VGVSVRAQISAKACATRSNGVGRFAFQAVPLFLAGMVGSFRPGAVPGAGPYSHRVFAWQSFEIRAIYVCVETLAGRLSSEDRASLIPVWRLEMKHGQIAVRS